jgi:hypothetical protein
MPSDPEEFSRYRLIEPNNALKQRLLAAASPRFESKPVYRAIFLNRWFLTTAAMVVVSVAAQSFDSWLTYHRFGSAVDERTKQIAFRPMPTQHDYPPASPLLLSMLGRQGFYGDAISTEDK